MTNYNEITGFTKSKYQNNNFIPLYLPVFKKKEKTFVVDKKFEENIFLRKRPFKLVAKFSLA
jgi:hypothetical protein